MSVAECGQCSATPMGRKAESRGIRPLEEGPGRASSSCGAGFLDHPNDSDTRTKVVAWMFAHGREQAGLEWAMAILSNNPNHVPTCLLLADYYSKRPDGAGLANLYRMKAAAQVSSHSGWLEPRCRYVPRKV